MARGETVTRWMVFFAVVAAVLVWAWNMEKTAERQARAFCDNTKKGQPFAEVVERARATGDNRLRIILDDLVLVAFKGVTAFSRHGCEVQAKDGKVASMRYLKLD